MSSYVIDRFKALARRHLTWSEKLQDFTKQSTLAVEIQRLQGGDTEWQTASTFFNDETYDLQLWALYESDDCAYARGLFPRWWVKKLKKATKKSKKKTNKTSSGGKRKKVSKPKKKDDKKQNKHQAKKQKTVKDAARKFGDKVRPKVDRGAAVMSSDDDGPLSALVTPASSLVAIEGSGLDNAPLVP